MHMSDLTDSLYSYCPWIIYIYSYHSFISSYLCPRENPTTQIKTIYDATCLPFEILILLDTHDEKNIHLFLNFLHLYFVFFMENVEYFN